MKSDAVQKMQAIAHMVDEAVRPLGFAVLVFETGKPMAGRMNYVSNAERDSMIVALKEMVAQLEGRVAPGGGLQ